MQRKDGFTLIELLVVIAIISILAALLFPAFIQAKESAKQTVCISNMKQIGMAMMLYRDSSDDVWVPATMASGDPNIAVPQIFWIGYDTSNAPLEGGFYGIVTMPAVAPPAAGLIDPFLKSDAIKKCPSTPSGTQTALAYNWFSPNDPSDYFAANPDAQGNEFGPGARSVSTVDGFLVATGVHESEIEESANTLVLWEHRARSPVCNFLHAPDWFSSPPKQPIDYEEHFNAMHRGGTSTLWADGHAKRLVYSQLKRPMFSCRKDIYQLN